MSADKINNVIKDFYGALRVSVTNFTSLSKVEAIWVEGAIAPNVAHTVFTGCEQNDKPICHVVCCIVRLFKVIRKDRITSVTIYGEALFEGFTVV